MQKERVTEDESHKRQRRETATRENLNAKKPQAAAQNSTQQRTTGSQENQTCNREWALERQIHGRKLMR
jgi:hypothetical protein